jgi:hypothetical protein
MAVIRHMTLLVQMLDVSCSYTSDAAAECMKLKTMPSFRLL